MNASPLLALDLSTQTGWAVRRAGGNGQIVSGTHRVAPPGTPPGPYLAAFARWLVDLLAVEEPRFVVFESPIVPSTARLETLRKLYGLVGLTEMICHRREIPVNEANNSTVLKHFTGNGGGKKPERKARCMKRCRELGFNPIDDNEADALAILHFAEHCLEKAMAA